MKRSTDMSSETRVFRDTLIYTVVLNAVRGLVSERTETELFLLVLLFSVVVFILLRMNTYLVSEKFPLAVGVQAQSVEVKFARFVGSTVLNVALQFQSSFVANLAVTALSPEQNVAHVVVFATYGIILLWMLHESLQR